MYDDKSSKHTQTSMSATRFSLVLLVTSLQRVVRRTPDTHCSFEIDWSLPTSARRCVSTAAAASHSDIRCNTYRTCECASPAECTDTRQRIIRVPSLQLWQESRAISHENKMTTPTEGPLSYSWCSAGPISVVGSTFPGSDFHTHYTCKYEEPGVLSHDTLRNCTMTGKSNNKS
jgi:hypothetical protein